MNGFAARLRSVWRWLRRRDELESGLDEEMRAHVQLRAEDLLRHGLAPGAALRQARLEFGGIERYKEEARAALGLRVLDDLRGDVRHAVRSLRRSPVFTLAAVLTLALGAGANSAVFSLVSASLLRPLPFERAGELVVLYQTRAESPGAEPYATRWSYPEFEAVRSALTTVGSVAAYTSGPVNVADEAGGEPLYVDAEMVSAAYFDALRVRPAAGRFFLSEEDSVPGARAVVVIGHGLWARRFGAAPEVVGRRLVVNGVPLEVVGVAPAGFGGLSGEAELWVPQAMAPLVSFPEQLTSPEQFHSVVGRLEPGVTLEAARAEVAVAGLRAAEAARAAANAADETSGRWTAEVELLEDARRHPSTVRAQLVLAGAVSFILLIAVVNLSALSLARAVARARETAVRAALGAGRLRLLRPALVEGGLLGVLGGGLAILLAWASVRVVLGLAPERWGAARSGPRFADVAMFAEPRIDWRVVAFALAAAVTAGVLASIIAAVRVQRGGLDGLLRAGGRGVAAGMGSLRRPTALSLAAVVQIACALVLLAGSAALLREFDRLRSIDPGFQPAGVLTFRISPPERAYGGEAAAPFLERVLASVKAVPGVRYATVSLCAPYARCSWTSVRIEGRPAADRPPLVGRHYVAPDHFRALGIPLLRGRALTAEDRPGRPSVAVINETAARRLWPGEDPIGKRVWFASGAQAGGVDGSGTPDPGTEIVGVVGDVLYGRPGEAVEPDFYTSYLQFTWPRTTVIVRAAVSPASLVPAVRSAVADVDPAVAIHDVQTMEDLAADALAPERFATAALGSFAVLGLLLASLGIYGIVAFAVAQRRREIGIRLALGSTPGQISRLIVGRGLSLAAVGLLLGTAAVVPLSRALAALLAGAEPPGPAVLAAAVPVLLGVALLACYLPARSAARVNPVETMSVE